MKEVPDRFRTFTIQANAMSRQRLLVFQEASKGGTKNGPQMTEQEFKALSDKELCEKSRISEY